MLYQDKITSTFKSTKPLLAMLHLKGDSDKEILERAITELNIYKDNHIHGIVVENYFGKPKHVEMVLSYLQEHHPTLVYGVNLLDDDVLGFQLANKYQAKFIQLDSVAGHLIHEDDITFHDFMMEQRENCNIFVLGGVRFKYQPYKSGRSLEEDLKIGMTRCDGIVVTSDETGQETDIQKTLSFRVVIEDFPLFIGAGLTVNNLSTQLQNANGGVIGSYLKDTRKDTGDVYTEHVEELMKTYNSLSL